MRLLRLLFGNPNQKQCIRHKLWGKLKREAYQYYRVAPVYSNDKYYVVEFWCVDHYTKISNADWLTLEKAKKEVAGLREEKFYKLCCEALYNRRLAKAQKC